jgi:2-polyprenyl-3-methyl-5-hydroxy-6-metoxy-1,4-benzoquinol methylase
MLNCPVCNNDLNNSQRYYPKEMMIGKRIRFEYINCKTCNCLFIVNIPENLKEYYIDYYTTKKSYTLIYGITGYLWKIRSLLALNGLYPLIAIFAGNSVLGWLSNLKLTFSDQILDVGCGNGDLLFEFAKHGFKNLYGVDPYPPEKNTGIFNWKFVKGDIFSIANNKFKLIMFNHSLEHIFDHYKILSRAKELLNDDGRIMIRMPVVNKAFEDYKENWAQLDAPRHLLIHSRKSFELLCSKLRLKIYKVLYDSTEFQFLGSIQYGKDIGYYEPDSYKVKNNGSLFSPEDIKKYKALAKHYNKLGIGDQAAFFIKKTES